MALQAPLPGGDTLASQDKSFPLREPGLCPHQHWCDLLRASRGKELSISYSLSGGNSPKEQGATRNPILRMAKLRSFKSPLAWVYQRWGQKVDNHESRWSEEQITDIHTTSYDPDRDSTHPTMAGGEDCGRILSDLRDQAGWRHTSCQGPWRPESQRPDVRPTMAGPRLC